MSATDNNLENWFYFNCLILSYSGSASCYMKKKTLKVQKYVDTKTVQKGARKQYQDIKHLSELSVSDFLLIYTNKTLTDRISGLNVGNAFSISPNRTLRTFEQYPWICLLKTR